MELKAEQKAGIHIGKIEEQKSNQCSEVILIYDLPNTQTEADGTRHVIEGCSINEWGIMI